MERKKRSRLTSDNSVPKPLTIVIIMIKLDISTLVFFYTLFSAAIILVIWLFSGYRNARRRETKNETDYIWKCSVCYHSYINSKDDQMVVCPLCGSYNKREVPK